MARKTALVIVPGAFCASASLYDPFIKKLASIIPSDQFEAHAFDLQSSTRRPGDPRGPASLYDDADFIRLKTEELLKEGKDVILLGHSYGGMVVTQTVPGLPIKDAAAGDDQPALKGLIYLTGLVPKKGETGQSMLQTGGTSDTFVKMEGAFMCHDNEKSGPLNFSDEPREEAIELARRCFAYHSVISFINECTHEGWRDVPKVGYVFCEEDRTLDPKMLQKPWIAALQGREKGNVQVVSIPTGHIPVIGKNVGVVAEAVKTLVEGMV